MNYTADTITALATPQGRASVGIVRVSGLLTTTVARALLKKIPCPRQAEYLPFLLPDGSTLDQGIALFFPAPHSFTGEDVLEFHGHGGPVVLDLLLQHIISLPGLRIARPGEFSERAFLNNKLDLAQAEAIADLIDASSAQAVRSAINSLQGIFSSRIHALVESIINLRMSIEAYFDFADEAIPVISHDDMAVKLNQIIANLNHILREARQGSLLRHGMKIVIFGQPNAGKSSLMNVLAGREVAIVTALAGTTRDILREQITLDDMPVSIIDTAGLCNSSNEVEQIGINLAWREIAQADHLLLVVDGSTIKYLNSPDSIMPEISTRIPLGIPVTIIRNKADLTGDKIGKEQKNNYTIINISAKSGAGIELLRQHIKQSIGFIDSTEGVILARRRHLHALETAAIHLTNGKEQLSTFSSIELLAEELRLTQQVLSTITGQFTSEDLIRKIFANFCLGK